MTISPLGISRTSTISGPYSIIGWASITSTTEIGVVTVLKYLQVPGDVITSTSILPDPVTEAFSFPAKHRAPASTALALLNPSDTETATVNVKLYDRDGDVQEERMIELSPQGKVVQFLNEGELFTDLGIFYGTAEVSSTLPLAAMVIEVEKTDWSTSRVYPPRE
jgi:hypothetical protein